MIELVFVIVIIGILAAVAIPKLAATREDALVARKAHNITNIANSIAAYAVARGETDPDMRKMSTILGMMIDQGEATQTGTNPPTVRFRWKAVPDCVVMKIEGQGENTEMLVIETNTTAAVDRGCSQLRRLIDTQSFPMLLRGIGISR